GTSMRSFRIPLITAGVFLLAQMVGVVWLGTSPRGSLVSNLLQLGLGILVVIVSLKVARRSGTLARHVWRLTALAYAVWGLGQALATYGSAYPSGFTEWLVNLLFSFWFVPIGMALFLGPDSQPGEFDWLVGIDCVQAILFWVAAYVYFFVIPSHYNEIMGMAPSVLALYFAYYGVLTAAFLLRAVLSGPGMARELFARMGLVLLLSGLIDAYYSYGPGKYLAAGAWFYLLWSVMLVIPLVVVSTWQQAVAPEETRTAGSRNRLSTQR